jgi:hypothetical protein
MGSAPFPGVRDCSSIVASDGRILRQNLYQQFYFYRAGPDGFTQLGACWRPPSHAECTTSIITDGRLIFRGRDCLYCYDLRK